MTLRELHLFAGIGGGILGSMMLGHEPVGAIEIDPFCRSVLRERQREGKLPLFPILHDVREFDGASWRGQVDCISGGFPCQDISIAGKGAGLAGARSGLWGEFVRIVRNAQPGFWFVENSPMLLSRGFDRVLGEMADLGFDAEWGVFSAAGSGAPHLRKRLWILGAHPDRQRKLQQGRVEPKVGGRAIHLGQEMANAGSSGLPLPERQELPGARRRQEGRTATECGWWAAEPDVGRMAHGVPARVDRLRALGNAQVPQVAARAFAVLRHRLDGTPVPAFALESDRGPDLGPAHAHGLGDLVDHAVIPRDAATDAPRPDRGQATAESASQVAPV